MDSLDGSNPHRNSGDPEGGTPPVVSVLVVVGGPEGIPLDVMDRLDSILRPVVHGSVHVQLPGGSQHSNVALMDVLLAQERCWLLPSIDRLLRWGPRGYSAWRTAIRGLLNQLEASGPRLDDVLAHLRKLEQFAAQSATPADPLRANGRRGAKQRSMSCDPWSEKAPGAWFPGAEGEGARSAGNLNFACSGSSVAVPVSGLTPSSWCKVGVEEASSDVRRGPLNPSCPGCGVSRNADGGEDARGEWYCGNCWRAFFARSQQPQATLRENTKAASAAALAAAGVTQGPLLQRPRNIPEERPHPGRYEERRRLSVSRAGRGSNQRNNGTGGRPWDERPRSVGRPRRLEAEGSGLTSSSGLGSSMGRLRPTQQCQASEGPPLPPVAEAVDVDADRQHLRVVLRGSKVPRLYMHKVTNQILQGIQSGVSFIAVLDFSSTWLDDDRVATLLKPLQERRPILERLLLDGNFLTDRTAVAVAQLLATLPQPVQELHLGNNHLSEEGALALLAAIGRHRGYPRRSSGGAAIPLLLQLQGNPALNETFFGRAEAELFRCRAAEGLLPTEASSGLELLACPYPEGTCTPSCCQLARPHQAGPLVHLPGFPGPGAGAGKGAQHSKVRQPPQLQHSEPTVGNSCSAARAPHGGTVASPQDGLNIDRSVCCGG